MKQCAVVFCITGFVLLVIGCKQNADVAQTKETITDTIHFFPVADYIFQQINSADTAAFLYRITVREHKKDSVAISKQTFDSLAKNFIASDITDSAVKKFYKENVFQDESTDSYTISYTCVNDSLPLQNVEVLLSRQDEQVKRIFMNVQQRTQDSTVIKKMGWKTNNSFYINRIVSYANGKSFEEQNMIFWRNKD